MQPYYRNYIISILVSLAISIGLQIVFPWPYGMIAVIGLFMAYPLILRNRMTRNMGGMGSATGGLFGQGQGFQYVCLVCGNKFKGVTCPRCGSKTKRADF